MKHSNLRITFGWYGIYKNAAKNNRYEELKKGDMVRIMIKQQV